MAHLLLLADDGLSQNYGLYGSLGLLGSGLLALAGVIFTAVRQGRTADRAAETERKINLFEEQDRMLERSRQAEDRADKRTAAAEGRAEAIAVELERVRSERDDYRRRLRLAEERETS